MVKYATQGLDFGNYIEELGEKPAPHIVGSPTGGHDVLNGVQRVEAVVRWVQGESLISKDIRGQEFQVYSQFLCILIGADIAHRWVDPEGSHSSITSLSCVETADGDESHTSWLFSTLPSKTKNV